MLCEFQAFSDPVANYLSYALIVEPNCIDDVICFLFPTRTKDLVSFESRARQAALSGGTVRSINHHERRAFLSAAKPERHCDAIIGSSSLTPLSEDEIEMRAVARKLAQRPLDEVRREASTAFMNVAPDRAAGATATLTRSEVLFADGFYCEGGCSHE